MGAVMFVQGSSKMFEDWAESFLPTLTGKTNPAHASIFAEKTYHEHYDPIRCVRTDRFKFIRNFAERPNLVMPSDIYNSPTRQSMQDDEAFWGTRPSEELYNLEQDPGEVNNLASDPKFEEIKRGLEHQLIEWMSETSDPLLNGPIERPSARLWPPLFERHCQIAAAP